MTSSEFDDLPKIPVENFVPLRGTMESFRNSENFELSYAFAIPLAPIDTGLSWEPQPEEPVFRLDPFTFPQQDWRELEGQHFEYAESGADNSSVYIGSAHNPVDVKSIRFVKRDDRLFVVQLKLFCVFDFEGVGKNETIDLIAEVEFMG